MTLQDLRDLFRREMFDEADPPLWTDPLCDEFANDAQMEAVRRGFLIIDSTTPEICSISYDTSTPVLPLDPRVIAIRSGIIRGQVVPLERMPARRLELLYPGWRTHTSQYPWIVVHDWGSKQLRLYPWPKTPGVVDMSVAREPLAPMIDADDEPELPARCHRGLVHWMKARGYAVHDTETEQAGRQKESESKFTAEFGQRKSLRNEKWQEEQAGQHQDTLV